MKRRLLISLMLMASTQVLASEGPVRTFSFAGIYDLGGENVSSIGFTHFFADQTHGGTYDEFGYLNTDSSISVAFVNSDFIDVFEISGEKFIGNLLLGGGYAKAETNFGESDGTSLKVGYLFNDNLILSAVHVDGDGLDGETEFAAEYNHELSDSDYFAVTATVDSEFDVFSISPTYFKKMSDLTYIRLGLDYLNTPGEDEIFAHADYYFSPTTSVGGSAGDGQYSIRGKHYLTFNVAVEAGYEDADEGVFYLNLYGQF